MILEKLVSQGNDFLVTKTGEHSGKKSMSLMAIRLCERNFGIGADGIIWFDWEHKTNKLFCNLFNADGSEAGFSGNGFACLSSYIFSTTKTSTLTIVCSGREYQIDKEAGRIRIQCQKFALKKSNLPTSTEIFSPQYTLVDVGNPHAVVFDNKDERIVESHFGDLSLFPDGINVNLAQICENSIELRVHERGVGWTKSCSSGCLATAIVAHRVLRMNTPITVKQAGGVSVVSYCEKSDSYYLELKPRWIATVKFHADNDQALEN